MAQLTVSLSLLFTTWAVVGAAECQKEAVLEGSCDPRLKRHVALQSEKGQPVKSVVKAKQTGKPLTQSGLFVQVRTGHVFNSSFTEVGQTLQNVVEEEADVGLGHQENQRKSNLLTQNHAFSPGMFDKVLTGTLDSYDCFFEKLGKAWEDLDREVIDDIIEFAGNEVELTEALGETWHELPDEVKKAALSGCEQESLLQISKQGGLVSMAWWGRITSWFHKVVNWVVASTQWLKKMFGKAWSMLPSFVRTAILEFCGDENKIKWVIGKSTWDMIPGIAKDIALKHCKKASLFEVGQELQRELADMREETLTQITAQMKTPSDKP